jgi:hypothetical protein
MNVYCNQQVSEEILQEGDWVVHSDKEIVAVGIGAGCNTIYIGDEIDSIRPSLFAPSVEDALRFISAHEKVT